MSIIPPSNPEIEKSIIGLMITYPEEDYSQLEGDDFYGQEHRLLYNAMKKMRAESIDIDMITVYNQVKDTGISISTITEYGTGIWTISSINSYIKTLKELRRKREAIKIGNEIIHLSDGDPSKMVGFASKLQMASTIGMEGESSVSYDDVTAAYEQIIGRFGKKLYGYSWGPDFEFLDEVTKGIVKKRVYRIGAPSNTGKAMPYYEKVLTPKGFTEIGDLAIGDKVNNSYGGISKVIGVFPQGKKPIYRMTLSDGSVIDSCENHLWAVHNNDWSSKDYKVLELKDILKSGIKRNTGGYKFSIPLSSGVEFDSNEVTISPYVMGILLSEGNLGKSHIQITNTDSSVKERVSNNLNGDKVSTYTSSSITYGIIGGGTIKSIRDYGLSLHRSWEKFIPEDYLYSSIDSRKELLEGLIDGDGCVDNSAYVYTTVSKQLAEDVKFLAQSLGGLVHISSHTKTFKYKGELKKGRLSYDVRISLPFTLNLSVSYKNNIKPRIRKLSKSIIDISYIGDMDCVCIAVDAVDHLYITSNFTLTHNTQFVYNIIPSLLEQKNDDGTPVKVAFFTLENTKEDTLISLMCNHSGLDASKVNSGELDGNWDWLTSLKDRLYIIDDVYDLDKIFSKIISIHPDIVILDYITHVTVAKSSGYEKYDTYAETVPKFAKSQDLAWIDLSNLPKNLQINDEIRAAPGFFGSSILMNNCDVSFHLMKNAEFKKTKETVLKNMSSKLEDKVYFYTRACLDLLVTKNRWGSVFVEKTYGLNFASGGKWKELSEDDLLKLWAKYG